MRRFHSLTLLAVLILPCFARAGDELEMTVGTLRKECLALREWNYWRPSCDIVLEQIEEYSDDEITPVSADFYIPFKAAFPLWEAEKNKTFQQRNREAIAAEVRDLLFYVQRDAGVIAWARQRFGWERYALPP